MSAILGVIYKAFWRNPINEKGEDGSEGSWGVRTALRDLPEVCFLPEEVFIMVKRSRLSKNGSKPRSTRLGRSKYSCGAGFGRAYDAKGRLVGYVGTLTWFGDKKPDVAPDMKTYVISYLVEQEGKAYPEEITVHAVDLEAMKTALGWYSKYEREWGDYAGVVERLEKGLADVFIRYTKMTKVDFHG